MLSIFTLGLWPILVLFLIGAGYFGYKSYKAHKLGDKGGRTGWGVFTAVMLLASILFLLFAGK